MITLTILMIIWFIISTYRINKICKEKEIGFFNPYEAGFLNYFGFIFGFATLVMSIIAIFWYYLP